MNRVILLLLMRIPLRFDTSAGIQLSSLQCLPLLSIAQHNAKVEAQRHTATEWKSKRRFQCFKPLCQRIPNRKSKTSGGELGVERPRDAHFSEVGLPSLNTKTSIERDESVINQNISARFNKLYKSTSSLALGTYQIYISSK